MSPFSQHHAQQCSSTKRNQGHPVKKTFGLKLRRKKSRSMSSRSTSPPSSSNGSDIEMTSRVSDSCSQRTSISDLEAVVINLDRRPDRMERCSESIRTNSPSLPYVRLPAADGKVDIITSAEVAHSWHTGMNCVYQKIRSQRKGWKDLDTYVPRELKLSPGERGCSMSHIRAWRHCLQIDRPLLVFEDDAMLMPDFTPILVRALDRLPEDAQVLYLGYSQAAPWRKEISNEVVESEYVWTTVSYIIWPSGARHFLSQLPINQPVDNWMASHSATEKIKSYAVRPKIVRQAEDWNVSSDVVHSDENVGYTLEAAGFGVYLSHNTHHSVDLWWDAAKNQKWEISPAGEGLYFIRTVVNTSGGRVYLSHDTHKKIDLWNDPGANQRWKLKQHGANTFSIRAASKTSSERAFLGRIEDGVELVAESERTLWVVPGLVLE